ncbi:MAG: Gfo/Idh/MocA family oxidoreductase [Planctomycetota bacterium]|nr:Gfo/Idh/MocA family oxidoreductase [Planctomycetota bacterium]
MFHRVTRRMFLKGTAATAGLTVLGGSSRAGAYEANQKLNCANIGVGGQGGSHLGPAAGENLIAICDVDGNTLARVAQRYPQARKFADYRQLFDEMGKSIDVVFVATPDHHHFPASLAALQRGKHVYCEKPLTHSIWEARTLALEARKAKVATQMGNQGQASEGRRRLSEFIWAGAIGKVTEVHIWTDRAAGWWPQGRNRPTYTDPVPGRLAWDLWLGPSPERPFVSVWREPEYQNEKHEVYHSFVWRGWWDFGTGALGDIACHAMDPAFRALKLTSPTAVEAKCEGLTSEMFPLWSIITYEYPARGDMPPVKLVWYDGKKKPERPPELEADRQWGDNGQLFIGEKGKILYDQESGGRIIPESKMEDFKKNLPPKTIPRSPGHHEEFLLACKGAGPAPGSNFDHAGPMTEAALTGNLAIRFGKRIEWDGPNMKAKNCPEADALIYPQYRPGWVKV